MADRITWLNVREWQEDASQWGITGYNCVMDGAHATAESDGIAIKYKSGTEAGYTLHFPWHVVLSYRTRNAEHVAARSLSVADQKL